MTKWIRIVHPNSYQYFSARTRELCQTHTSEHINAPGFISLHRVRHTRAIRATITWPSVLSPGVSKLVGFFSSIPSRSPLIICVSVQASLRNCLNDLSHMSLSLSVTDMLFWQFDRAHTNAVRLMGVEHFAHLRNFFLLCFFSMNLF